MPSNSVFVETQLRSLGTVTPRSLIHSADELLFAQHCAESKLPAPAQRFCFATVQGQEYIANFAFPDFDLLIDLHGVIFYGGPVSSSRPAALELNIERQQYAARNGFIVLPFTSAQVRSQRAIECTYGLLRRLGWRA